jgi:tRNA (guanine-N7-)-methyltransferase
MKKRRQIEREFGVPIAGQILEPEKWTRTAFKNLPEHGRLDWAAIFGRQAPVILDIGCGNGRFPISSAVWRPDHDHFASDILPVVIRYATRRANQRGLTNVRFAVVDGLQLLERYVPSGGVAEAHCYHPQPYDDPKLVARRLITPHFLSLIHSSLIPGGLFFVQTDHPGYWSYIREVAPSFFDFSERASPWPDAPKGRTRREIIALRRGLTVFRGVGTARADLTAEARRRLVLSLPLPLFAPDQRSRELDELERRIE